MMRAIVFMTIVTSLLGCGNPLPVWAPPVPEIHKCTYSWKFKKFRCTNNKTKVREDRALDGAEMEGAQCLSLPDFNKGERWVDDFAKEARRRTK